MRVSEYFSLNRTQGELDFVDVDVVGDIPVFIDPRGLRIIEDEWGAECIYLIQNCFQYVIDLLRTQKQGEARQVLKVLREPNETHLGLSVGVAQGRAVGRDLASDVAKSLGNSIAARTGLLEDLEDTVLMVEGIGPDIISDMTTNIIRGPLIRYTQVMCNHYGIPFTTVGSGPIWNPDTHEWSTTFVEQPVVSSKKLLLVPKSIVRLHLDYDSKEYYRDFLLNHLEQVELSANTELVCTAPQLSSPG